MVVWPDVFVQVVNERCSVGDVGIGGVQLANNSTRLYMVLGPSTFSGVKLHRHGH